MFLSIYKNAEFIIGNSSSGVLESASIPIGAINVGYRQRGRRANENLLFIDSSLEKIGENLSNAVKLINPLGEETSVMRTSLVPAMLEILSRNLSRKVDFFSGFEVGNIFSNPDAPVQKRAIVAGVYGKEEDFFGRD